MSKPDTSREEVAITITRTFCATDTPQHPLIELSFDYANSEHHGYDTAQEHLFEAGLLCRHHLSPSPHLPPRRNEVHTQVRNRRPATTVPEEFLTDRIATEIEDAVHTTEYTDTLILSAWTRDDLLFDIHCERKQIPAAERESEHERFFSTGQACLRTSPLAKTYGWALHFDFAGRIALLPMNSERVTKLESDPSVTVKTAMKRSR